MEEQMKRKSPNHGLECNRHPRHASCVRTCRAADAGPLSPVVRPMKMNRTLITSAFVIALVITSGGCIRETTNQELVDLSLKAQMNTIATTLFYTGSDDTYDYFYLDIPFGRNDACKVPRSETTVTNKMPVTRDRRQWRIFSALPPISAPLSLTNTMALWNGTNTLIILPGTNIKRR